MLPLRQLCPRVSRPSPFPSSSPALHLILLSPLGPMRPPNRWLENLKSHRGDGNQTLWCVNQTERDSLMRLCAHETEPRTERRATPKTTPTNKPYLSLRGGLLSVSAEPTTAFVSINPSYPPLYQNCCQSRLKLN